MKDFLAKDTQKVLLTFPWCIHHWTLGWIVPRKHASVQCCCWTIFRFVRALYTSLTIRSYRNKFVSFHQHQGHSFWTTLLESGFSIPFPVGRSVRTLSLQPLRGGPYRVCQESYSTKHRWWWKTLGDLRRGSPLLCSDSDSTCPPHKAGKPFKILATFDSDTSLERHLVGFISFNCKVRFKSRPVPKSHWQFAPSDGLPSNSSGPRGKPLPVTRSVLLFISILMILALKILVPSQEDDDALQKTLEKNPGYPLFDQVDGFRVVTRWHPFQQPGRDTLCIFSTKKPRGIHKTAFLGAVVMLRGFSSNRMVTFLVQSFLPPADLQEHLRRILRLSKWWEIW